MRVENIHTELPESKWEKIEWNLELKALERELQHLRQKSEERELTEWELKRLASTEIELSLNSFSFVPESLSTHQVRI